VANVLQFLKPEILPPRPHPTAGLLRAAAGHAAPEETPIVPARINLGLLEGGLSNEIDVIKAAIDRLPVIPTKASSLAELVKRGRRQLLDTTHKARQAELEVHHTAVVGLLASIQPDR
jgi:hypothetical protein